MSGEFVLDSSVALSWCFEDEADEFADSVLGSLEDQTAFVPSILWQLEVCSGLIIAERRGRLTDLQVRERKTWYGRLRVVGIESPVSEIFELARKHQRTAYDGAYLALASRAQLPLATLDGGLRQAAREAGVELLNEA